MKNKIFLILFVLVILTGCGKKDSEVTVVLDWTVNTNHTGLYAALEQGYFSEQGLNVSIQAPPQNGAMSLVLNGQAEFAVSYQEEITYARAQGLPVKAVAAVIQHNTSAFASRKRAEILSPRDFEGKRYGGWGSPMEEAMLKALMKEDGGDYSKVEILSIGDMDFFAATEKNIDFAWIFKGWDGVQAELKGIELNVITLGDKEKALDYYTPVLAAKEEYLSANGGEAKKFLAAVSKGYTFAMENPVRAAEILLKYAPELDRDLVVASQKYLAGEYRAEAPRWGEMQKDVWDRYAVWMKGYSLLDGEFDADQAFTNAYLP